MSTLDEQIQAYERLYATTPLPMVKRLPLKLLSEEDTFCRLAANYKLLVRERGHEAIMDDHTVSKLKSVAKWLFCSQKSGLLLCGTLGNGKSTMLQSIYRLFRKSSAAMGDAQDIYFFYKENQCTLKYWNEPLLLIDDLGVEPARCITYGEESYPMSRLLLNRYDKRLTTIIATNLSYDAIQERYGDRVVDRMIETYDAIKYEAESYRRWNH